jgi:hypothetical protein
MLSYEHRTDHQFGGSSHQSSVNVPSRGHGTSWPSRGASSSGHGRCPGRGSPSAPRGGYNNTNFRRGPSTDAVGGQNRSRYQVYTKVGHTADICWYRYDEAYAHENHTATMGSTSGNDPNWYLDSSATDHITSDLERFTMHERYNGGDQIRTANGAGMDIFNISHSVLLTPTRLLHLHQVLHVPHSYKQLVSIHWFNLDNHTFIELHPFFFLIKDQATRKVLLRGPCRGGLYPLTPLSPPTQKLLVSAIKPSSQRWHLQLGHPARDIVL